MQRACFLHQVCALGSLNMMKPLWFLPGHVCHPVRPHSHIPMPGAPLAVLLVQQDLCEFMAGTADPHAAHAGMAGAEFARAVVGRSGHCGTII